MLRNKKCYLLRLKITTIFAFIILLGCSQLIFNSKLVLDKSNKTQFKTAYDTFSPILISGDNDFKDKVILYGWNGSGIEGDPYEINNLNITSTSSSINLVDISHTRKYFRLESNLLEGGASGVMLHNVSNAILQDNIINNCVDYGILLDNSSLNFLKNNTVTNTAIGVYFENSNNNDFLENIISNITFDAFLCDYYGFNLVHNNTVINAGYSGIKIRDSPQNIISDNIVHNCDESGILIAASGLSIISNNTVKDTKMNGIYIMVSNNCNISDNLIFNSNNGIRIDSSTFINFDHNTIYNNSFFGLSILSCDSINISRNNFLYNHDGMVQGSVDGANLNITYNYWTDWVVPDENDDNYVDLPYGLGETYQDPYPLAKAYICEKIHLLTVPTLNPLNDSMISGTRRLSWAIASDTKGHDVTYQLYYSSDAGNSWNLVTANIIDNYYYWDTNSVPDGNSYVLKIVANCSDGLFSEDKFEETFTIRNIAHTISRPTILSPLSNKISESYILIEWTSCIDSWGFLVKYSLFYSIDNGTTWETIVEEINVTNYSWQFSQSIDSFLLKVAAVSQGGLTNETISGPYIIEREESRIGTDSQLYLFTFILMGISVVILSKRKVIKKN